MSDGMKPPTIFWVISIAALLWYLLGCVMYYSMTQMTVETVTKAYGAGFAEIFETKPAWATGAFAISVFVGLLGCIGLLLRKAWAKILFIISLIGVVIHDIWGVMAGTLSHVGTFDKIMTIVVLAISIFMIWFAHKKAAKGYLT